MENGFIAARQHDEPCCDMHPTDQSAIGRNSRSRTESGAECLPIDFSFFSASNDSLAGVFGQKHDCQISFDLSENLSVHDNLGLAMTCDSALTLHQIAIEHEHSLSIILVGTRLRYTLSSTTSFLLNISVAQNSHQCILNEKIEVYPFQNLEKCQVGPLGNRLYRLIGEPGELSISYEAAVELHVDKLDSNNVNESQYAELPPDVLPFLNPSRYCESDKLYRFASDEFGYLVPGYSRVTAICNWTFDHLTYTPASTGPTTTACDVLLQRTGVCRDYAHVAISLCRAMGIPARYVSGYAVRLQPPDFHGFFEAYLEGRWFLFDATRLVPVGGLVRIGTGRDAADVAFATILGQAECLEMCVWANDANPSDRSTSGEDIQSGISSA